MVKPMCEMEAAGDGHPSGAFYRVAEGVERTDDGWW
jgi:hypothetical protein